MGVCPPGCMGGVLLALVGTPTTSPHPAIPPNTHRAAPHPSVNPRGSANWWSAGVVWREAATLAEGHTHYVP